LASLTPDCNPASGFGDSEGRGEDGQVARWGSRSGSGAALQHPGDAYIRWVKRFILFHDKHHPQKMGPLELEAFLTNLVVDRNVAASTQHQALGAVLFLGREVLGRPIGEFGPMAPARWPERLPAVLSRDQVRSGGKQRGRESIPEESHRRTNGCTRP